MKFNFKNKNIFITGGTHGIGLSCVKKFSEYSANIITFSRDKEKVKKIENFLRKKNIKYMIEVGDATNKNFLDNFSKRCLQKFKKIDIFINNVGGGGRWGDKDLLKTNDNVWDEVYKKNNLSLQLLIKKFLPGMIKSKSGRIISIGSTSSTNFTQEDRPWFSAAKSAQLATMKSLSKKINFTKNNITFNIISPGPIFIKDTGWEKEKIKNPKKYNDFIKKNIPANRLGYPEEVANAVFFISSEYSSFINGSNLVIDGGLSNS
tara:strand:+ start:4142 stop:4927 length:786 start_codon:yes stop_codon:yes gene_type:complete